MQADVILRAPPMSASVGGTGGSTPHPSYAPEPFSLALSKAKNGWIYIC